MNLIYFRLSVEEYTCKLIEAARLTTFSLTEKREKEKEDRIQEAKMVKIRFIFIPLEHGLYKL